MTQRAKPRKRQSWSSIDIFGLINGISTWDPQYRKLRYVRKPFDSTLDIKHKILQRHEHTPNLSKQGLINGLSIEFGLTPNNVGKTSIFELSRAPLPSGSAGTQDIWVYHKPKGSSDDWTEIGPQVWGSGYLTALDNEQGFTVWQNNKYSNLNNIKNYTYSTLLQIFTPLPDKTEIKAVYYVPIVDEWNRESRILFTDMDNPQDADDKRFLYRYPEYIDPTEGIQAYHLTEIPSGLYNQFYNSDGTPTEALYSIKEHLDTKFKHKWKDIRDGSCIWDVHQLYPSGDIPHFYDAEAPQNDQWTIEAAKESGLLYSGYTGGIEEASAALYISGIQESSESGLSPWYPIVYPGKFYVDGVPYYLFSSPNISYLHISGNTASIPSGLEEGSYTIVAESGYYIGTQDEYLSGYVFEDYNYPTGKNGDSLWSNIYRRRPWITSDYGYSIELNPGEYAIDFASGVVRSNPDDNDIVIIWDSAIIPSGRLLQYDINPLNESTINKDSYIMYLSHGD